MCRNNLWSGKEYYLRTYGRETQGEVENLASEKRKRRWGIPFLQGYYYSAQLRPLVCKCSLDYTAGWKDIEKTIIKEISLTAFF